MAAKKKALLLDGLNLLFRSFYAMPPMASADGTPTNALYGFLRTLLSLVESKGPTLVVVALDLPGPTRRHLAYPEYKAGRDALPESLAPQIERFAAFLGHIGVPALGVEGYEADDVLASAAHRLAAEGWEVEVVSGDLDLLQILAANITVLRPVGRAADIEPMTAARLVDEYGFGPERIPDFKALAGDSSDNIPGVKGIGKKTAKALLAEHKDLAGVYAALDTYTPAKRQNLEDARDTVQLWLRLTTLATNLEVALPDEALPDLTTDPARQELTALGMASLLPVLGPETAPEPEMVAADEMARIWGEASEVVLIRTGDGLLTLADGRLVAVAGGGGLLAPEPEPAAQIATGAAVTGWTLKPLGLFARADLTLSDLRQKRFLLSADGGGLNSAWRAHLQENPPQADSLRLLGLPRLAKELDQALEEAGLADYYRDVEVPFVRAVHAMEAAGLPVDAGRLAELERHFGADIAAREAAIQRAAGCEFNPRSPAQVKEVLFTALGLPDNHSGSTRRSALEQIASLHPVIEMLLSYRERHKLLTTYVQPLQARQGDDGRIHPTYDPAGSATGRLACRHPNLQNLPVRTEEGRLIRSAFVAPKGSLFLAADYSQIDLRVLAHLSGDPGLAKVFATGRDIHTATAAMMTGKEESAITPDERRAAKTINFGIIYGMGPQRLASELSLKLDEAKERIEAYFAQFPRIRHWMDKVVAEGRELGYVTTFEGRRRPLPDLNSANRMLREAAERQAINTPVQGGSADIIKRAMVALTPLQDKNFTLLLQVHDELLFEVADGHLDEARDKAVSAMEGAVEWPTPVVVETKAGQDYAALS